MSRYQVNSMQDIRVTAEKLNMQLDTMRFFVGENRHESRCFGIYQDPSSLEYVVYKNKASGEHVERYRGYDESEAAQILWDKIESEIEMRQSRYGGAVSASSASSYRDRYLSRSANGTVGSGKPGFGDNLLRLRENLDRPRNIPSGRPHVRRQNKSRLGVIIVSIIIFCIIANVILPVIYGNILGRYNSRSTRGLNTRRHGYYQVDDDLYYYQGGNSWYYYNAIAGAWELFSDYDDSWYDDYYYGSSYDFSDPYDSFYYSDYYIDYTGNDYGSSNYDYDSYDYDYDYDYSYDYDDYDDYDWDWGGSDWDSWDSYDTDWDSDW